VVPAQVLALIHPALVAHVINNRCYPATCLAV
jgi:hypothetical protein